MGKSNALNCKLLRFIDSGFFNLGVSIFSGDKRLMQSLVFDAMVTDGLERAGPPSLKEQDKQ